MSKKSQYRERGTDTPEAPIGIVEIDTAAQAAKVKSAEMVPIFRVDGVTYSVPKAERADVSLRYLEISEDEGDDAAASYLLKAMLGENALAALAAVEGLEGKQFNAIMKAVKRIALPKDRGSRRG